MKRLLVVHSLESVLDAGVGGHILNHNLLPINHRIKRLRTISMTLQHKQITVVAIDDHELILQGIRYLLEKNDDIKLVAEGYAGSDIVPLVARHQPEVLLLDIGIPEERSYGEQAASRHSVFATLHLLQTEYPYTRTIIVSQYGTPLLAKAALSAGVKGYLIKDDALTSYLANAIRTVHRGGIFFSRSLQSQLIQARIGEPNPLQPRQIEILTAFVLKPNEDRGVIAKTLGISVSTLNYHLGRIYDVLKVNGLAAALVKAMEMDLLPVPPPDLPLM
ncbi:response regulator [bacterium]|nr:response regulator [bacterium]